jgi:hypothetical protein
VGKEMNMAEIEGLEEIDFGGPANYRVIVQGIVNPTWGDRLGDLVIVFATEECEHPRTVLEGRIRDQAELRGILETLYGLHLPILKVEKTEEDT